MLLRGGAGIQALFDYNIPDYFIKLIERQGTNMWRIYFAMCSFVVLMSSVFVCNAENNTNKEKNIKLLTGTVRSHHYLYINIKEAVYIMKPLVI